MRRMAAQPLPCTCAAACASSRRPTFTPQRVKTFEEAGLLFATDVIDAPALAGRRRMRS